MEARIGTVRPALPGHQGQFSVEVATEEPPRLRATQRVAVKPVVPRRRAPRDAAPEPKSLNLK